MSSPAGPSASSAMPTLNEKATCPMCGKTFRDSSNMNRHLTSCKLRKQRTCAKCNHTCSSIDVLNKHGCGDGGFFCKGCQSTFTAHRNLVKHINKGGCMAEACRRKEYRVNCVPNARGVVALNFKDTVGDVFFANMAREVDALTFLASISENVEAHITSYLREWRTLKVNFNLEVAYAKPSPDPELEEMRKDACFNTESRVVTQTTDLTNMLEEIFARISVDMDEFETSGSGWTMDRIDGLLVRLSKYTPLGAGSHIALPPSIARKDAVLNVRSQDDQCFKHAILSSLFDKSSFQQGVSDPNLCHHFNFDGITFPTPLEYIKVFEKNNNVTVNVYALDDRRRVFPLRISSFDGEPVQHFHLLMLHKQERHHYCLITDLSRLVRSQKTLHRGQHLTCERCFTAFPLTYVSKDGLVAEQRLARHKEWCKNNCPTRVSMPGSGAVSSFKNLRNQQRVPVVAYADMEALVRPTSQPDHASNPSTTSWTRVIAEHKIYSVGVLVVSTIPSFQPYPDIVVFEGHDAVDQFMAFLKNLMVMVDNLYDVELAMNLTPQEQLQHQMATECGICHRPFNRQTDVIVRHHCHMTGKYVCAAHQACNLAYQHPNFLPVFFHNLTNYDSHPIVHALAANNDLGEVRVIPNSKEKFISISKKFEGAKRWCRFLDSYRFMDASLETLAGNLSSHPRLTSFEPDAVKRALLLRKGVFPYSYLTDMSKLDEPQLPPKESFRNDLTDEDVTDEEYRHAQNVWSVFGCRTLGEYAKVYLKTDVYLLCEVFEAFRELVTDKYRIDPPWYFTLPSLAFDAMKLMTGASLELLTDYDQQMFVERGVRGGITSCVHRHAVANNKYIPETYDPTSPPNYLLLLDCTNLYGTAMSRFKLPYGGFEWVPVDRLDVKHLPDCDSDIGYLLEVDVFVPNDLHSILDELPPLPEKRVPPGSKGPAKLLTTLYPKKNYVVHYLLLKQAMNLGAVVTKVHRALKFQQSHWLSTYVSKNADFRKACTNKFEDRLFKNFTNSVFGKFLENLWNRMKLELVVDEGRLRKLINKPNFKDRTIINEKVVAVELKATDVLFDRPAYVGQAILDLSKFIMYEFLFDRLRNLYHRKDVQLMYMDTDSFFLNIRTEDLYGNDMRAPEFKQFLDLSNYPSGHPTRCLDNERRLGSFKDETAGVPIREYVGLRPKCYSYLVGGEEIKKAKGVKSSAVKAQLRFDTYKQVLLGRRDTCTATFKTIRSYNHEIKTVQQNKTALTSRDDKRHILPNGISTVAHGNSETTEQEILNDDQFWDEVFDD